MFATMFLVLGMISSLFMFVFKFSKAFARSDATPSEKELAQRLSLLFAVASVTCVILLIHELWAR